MESDEMRCINCQKLFLSDRIDLHEAYCRRNIKKCKQCDEFVDINELTKHQAQFHLKKACTHCKLDFLTNDLIQHVSQCPRRPKLCGYCETEFTLSQLAVHQITCGAKLRVCGNCHQNVMLKDFIVHETRCREPQPPNNIPRQPNSVNNLPNLPIHNRNADRRNNIGSRERERQSGENNARHHTAGGQHSLSTNKDGSKINNHRKKQQKYDKQIPLESPQPVVSIIPISVQLTINRNKKRQQREPILGNYSQN